MKKTIYTLITSLFAILIIVGCKKAEGLLYSDVSRVQLNDTATTNYSFFYKAPAVLQDTVFIRVNTIGKTSSSDRAVKFVQVVDPTVVNPAVVGKQYISFDDPSLKSKMVIKANAVQALIPIVLIRDASLKDNSYRLKFKLAASNDFQIGESKATTSGIIFSDRLERFYSWSVDSYLAPAYTYLGKYSTRKHQFMIDVLHEQIDEAWYQAIVLIGAQSNYQNLLRKAVIDYNNDPVNIANGSTPLRETASPSSTPISF